MTVLLNLTASACPESDDHYSRRGGESLRGKLRDKRTETRRDKLKRELMERRRATKRESRTAVAIAWQNQLMDDYLPEDDEEPPVEEIKN